MFKTLNPIAPLANLQLGMALDRAVTLLSGRKLRNVPRREVVMAIIKIFEPFKVISVQFGYDNILVVFEKTEGKASALSLGGIHICNKYIRMEGGAQVLTVMLFDYPFEGPEDPIKAALEPFGTYKDFRFQKYPYDDLQLFTGSRLIRFSLNSDILELPRSILIGGYYCRLWHRGQSIQCNICSAVGHKASSVPLKGKCLHCKKKGHFSRNCPDKNASLDEGEDLVDEGSPCQNGDQNNNADDPHALESPASLTAGDSNGDLGIDPASQDLFKSQDLVNNEPLGGDVIVSSDTSVDLRDNELDELSSQTCSDGPVDSLVENIVDLAGGPISASAGDSIGVSDAIMAELNLKKRSLEEDSSSESSETSPSADAERSSVSNSSSRRRRINPCVNLSSARSRSTYRRGDPSSESSSHVHFSRDFERQWFKGRK